MPDGSTARRPEVYDVLVYQEGGHYYARDRQSNLICIVSSASSTQVTVTVDALFG